MPVIIVFGLRNSDDTLALESGLKEVVASIEELGLSEDQVSCFFPKEFVIRHPNNEIIVFVEGLFMKQGRTEEVRNKLASQIGENLKNLFTVLPDVKLIEVFVRPFDPAWGFWSSAEEDSK